ncbi:MAG: hypothetical protein H6713_38790 [Myxococcales bacterium]|nr:hypothetical protein [Myxococcales bacterium]
MRDHEDARDRAQLVELLRDSFHDELPGRLRDYLDAGLERIESPAHLRFLLRVTCSRWEVTSHARRQLTCCALRRLAPLWTGPPDLEGVCRWVADAGMGAEDLVYLSRKTRVQRVVYRVVRELLYGKDPRKVLWIAAHGVAAELGRAAPPGEGRRAQVELYRALLRVVADELGRDAAEPSAAELRDESARFVDWLLEVAIIALRREAARADLEVALASIFQRPLQERGAALAEHLRADPDVVDLRVNAALLGHAFAAW